jgi:hypothetical protein
MSSVGFFFLELVVLDEQKKICEEETKKNEKIVRVNT